MSDRDLLRIPNLGRRSLNELRTLGRVNQPERENLPDDWPLDKVEDLPTRARTWARMSGFSTVGEVRRMSDAQILRGANVGRAMLTELRTLGRAGEAAAS